MSSRRNVLSDIKSTNATHAGLWLDKYIRTQERSDTDTRRSLVDEVSRISIPEIYMGFYTGWKQSLKSYGATCREATVQGRMVVGLGDESVLETSVTLHHTYGVPYIPGSALKGLAASFVRQWMDDPQWGTWEEINDNKKIWKPEPFYQVVFGNTDDAGYITFFDALYIPNTGYKGQVLYPDVMTVHHKKYYGDGSEPPADWDSPNPVPFISATGKYLIALYGQENWVDVTFKILEAALREMGVGAKTSSGYGRLVFEGNTPNQNQTIQSVVAQTQPPDPEQQKINELMSRIATLPNGSVANQIDKFVREWRSLTVRDELKQQVAQAIINKVREAGRERSSADKAWYKELVASLNPE